MIQFYYRDVSITGMLDRTYHFSSFFFSSDNITPLINVGAILVCFSASPLGKMV